MVAIAQLVRASDCGSEGLRVRFPLATPYVPQTNRNSNKPEASGDFSFPGAATSVAVETDRDQIGALELESRYDQQKIAGQEVNALAVTDIKRRISPSEMLAFIKYLQKYGDIQPRTYWYEIPFYTVIRNRHQKFCLGTRPEDLKDIETIEKKAWEKHLAYLKRLDRFPLDKAEYYIRLKESRGINGVRGLAVITGEDWSYIAKILRVLDLPEPIKAFLRNNKNDPGFIKFFHLRRLLDIVLQGGERLQLGRFNELMQEFEDEVNGLGV